MTKRRRRRTPKKKEETMSNDSGLTFILLGIGAYWLYQHYNQTTGTASAATGTTTAGGTGLNCVFPDGTTINMPAGNSCPFDAGHGGQSTPCYPSTFIGPPPSGASAC